MSQHDPDFDFEPIRGVPAPLPEGETILWQGAPGFKGLAIRAMHVRKVALYFGLLMLWRFVSLQSGGQGFAQALGQTLVLLPVALGAMGILSLIAWGYARTTVYTLTSRRLLIRSGIAIPVTLNLPLSKIASASLKLYGDGTGDIPVKVEEGERIIAMYIWPNVRPWSWNRPQPMLRGVTDAHTVATRFASALEGRPAVVRNPAAETDASGFGGQAAAAA